MITTALAVSFLIEEDDKVLIVEESKPEVKGKWDFPGGRIEEGETLEQAVERELIEEVGRKSQSTKLIRIYEAIREDGGLGVRFQFRVVLDKNIPETKLYDDISGHKWVTKEELKKMVDDHKVRPGIFHLTELCGYLKGYPDYVEIVNLNFQITCPCGSGKKYKRCHYPN